MTDVFAREIHGQPAALERAAAALDERALAAIAERERPSIVFTGMGASFDACLAVVSVLGSQGVPAHAVNTAELLHFRLPSVPPGALVVAVSQSGRSAELVRLGRELRGRVVVSITNGLDNPIARGAAHALDTRAGDESGPSTRTFAASFPPLAALARVLAGGTAPAAVAATQADAGAAAQCIARQLDDADGIGEQMLDWLGDRRGAVLVGRGTGRAAADVGALVLKEAAGLAAECLDAAEFRHGPLELAGPDLAVAVVATEERTLALDRALASELIEQGASTIVLGPDGDIPVGAVHRLFAPPVAAVPFQLLAQRLAVRRGRRPGEFTVATKVTTRE
jgi:glutamine---fructose-6-phosphate transaminase (isomerizing)